MSWSAAQIVEALQGSDPALAVLAPQLDMIMASGGDALIWPNAISRRTSFGTTTRPAAHEIWFSSTSAQSISRPAWDETLRTLSRLMRKNPSPLSMSEWFDDIRARIAQNFSATTCSVLLMPSAAEARDTARAIALLLLKRDLFEIATTPSECANFSESARPEIRTLIVDMRAATGDPREQSDIDADAVELCEAALESGQGVFFQLLDTSKTGLTGISRGAARSVAQVAPGRTLALVDASEGRTYANEVRRDLAQGMMVLVSGSQFVGGPPHCAALLLPDSVADALTGINDASGILPAMARFDAPRELRHLFAGVETAVANPGLGLRWSAALAEHDEYFRVSDALRRDILETFARKARAIAARCGFLTVEALLPDHTEDPLRESIVALIPLTPARSPKAMQYAEAIRIALAQPCPGLTGDAICHIGHAIPVADRAALPIAASAQMVNDVARRMAHGLSFDRAMTPVLRDLETLFRKWEALAG